MDGFDFPANTLPTPGYAKKDHDTAGYDDCCVGVIEEIRFSRNNKKDYTSVRFVGEPRLSSTHFTTVMWLRRPLYEAFKAKSVIKLYTPDCQKVTTEFQGFGVIARHYNKTIAQKWRSGNLPSYAQTRIALPDDFRMECTGKIIYIGYFTGKTPVGEGGFSPTHATIIELTTSQIKYFILYEMYRDILMHAFYDGMYVELASDGCHDPKNPTSDTIRLYTANPSAE